MTPEGLPPVIDLANTLLAPGTAHLLTGINGQLGVITIRTSTATVTVQLPKADVLAWAGLLKELGDSMTAGSGLLVATTPSVLLRP
jgi:hypothetical protein